MDDDVVTYAIRLTRSRTNERDEVLFDDVLFFEGYGLLQELINDIENEAATKGWFNDGTE